MISNERKYNRLYRKARKLLGDRTPLKTDCGVLCGGACCKGDEATGMLLFPGESTSLTVTERDSVRLAVCSGRCDRRERPLSCRIFPFFPSLDGQGRVRVVADTRGIGLCPMVANKDEIKFDRGFLWRVKKLGRLLSEDEECRKFLLEVSEDIRLRENLIGK